MRKVHRLRKPVGIFLRLVGGTEYEKSLDARLCAGKRCPRVGSRKAMASQGIECGGLGTRPGQYELALAASDR